MKNVQVLDCTLRDGGRIINCEFNNDMIFELSRDLTDANIDIVEIGFLRSCNLVHYTENSTFFTQTDQIIPFIPLNKKETMYAAFIDFGMYDFSCLEKCSGNSVTGIRVGFTKVQFDSQRDELRKSLMYVKKQGYELFIQGVNTLAYSDKELLDIIEFVNEIEPYSYGIVDTYGGMYLDDITHFYSIIDYNLNKDIRIDIHSHNNFQSSFAFAQKIIKMADGKRKIILDSTLNGMGKCAGNLNTELIVDYLVRKKDYDYDIDIILDTIDRNLYPLKKEHVWGYSIPAFMAGIYRSHPNNIIYLTEKYRLNSKDIKYIISSIDENTRQRYDYDNIQRIYRNYNRCLTDDTATIKFLKSQIEHKKVLVLAPGKSVKEYYDRISKYIKEEHPFIISVNFIPKNLAIDYAFYANTIYWEKISGSVEREKCIVVSNIHTNTEGTYIVDYSSLISEDSILYDNSTIMLLNLLKKLNVKEICLAGFDGLKENTENYIDETFPNHKKDNSYMETNREVRRLFEQYKNRVAGKIMVSCLTPSIYER